jgi:orotidine-5'-phosphate decarboxylase
MPTAASTSPLRDRLAIALDTSDLAVATSIASAVQPAIGIAKVGLQLFGAAGHDAVRLLRTMGMAVFLDVKLHDIPNTVYAASTVFGSLGVRYLTVHAAGGATMLQAAVQGLRDGAATAGLPPPMALAVTVLTSEPTASPELLAERLTAAVAGGCGGVVCAAADLLVIRSAAPTIVTVVPGIRPAGVPAYDQGRVATPAEAIRDGADILVLGRAVTAANDPAAAAGAIAAEIAQALRV